MDEYKELLNKLNNHRDGKRGQYLKMLNENKIKQPKQLTLEYCEIIKGEDKHV